jgi:hypothetical protein
VRYSLFHGARKLERRLLSKKMPNDHWEILKNLDTTAVKSRPLHEFLHRFDQNERNALLWAFQKLRIDEPEQRYAKLLTVAESGTEHIITRDDGEMLLMEYHSFLMELLENAKKVVRTLRNSYNKFCRPEHLSETAQTENKSTTTSSSKCKRTVPTKEELDEIINDVYVALRPLVYMAWRSDFFDWYITTYLRDSIQAGIQAVAVASADDDDNEDRKSDCDKRDNDEDDEDYEEGGSEPSGYAEAHTSFELNKPDKQMIAKEWVYWLRLVTAPLHYTHTVFAQTLSRHTPKLSFRLLTYPPSSPEMKPWKEVVKTMYPDPKEHEEIIEQVMTNCGDTTNMISDPNFSFKGVAHCEAVLACSHYLANSKESVDEVCPLSFFPRTYTDSLTVGGVKRCAGRARAGVSAHRTL